MSNKTKIYFWLKLDNNFYKNLAIKKARQLAGGDTMVIIYQKLMLESLQNDGVLYYEGVLENIVEELSLQLDEDAQNVAMTLDLFTKAGLIQVNDNSDVEMLQVPALIDQETNWGKYKRESRKKENHKKLDNVQPVSNQCPTDIEIDIDIEIDKEEYIAQTSLPDSLETRFNHLWSIYPKKEGRKQALAAYKRAVKKKVSDEIIKSGIEKYNAEIIANNTERKYIKQGSTFFNGEHWDDDYQTQQTNKNFIDDGLDLPF